MAESATATKPAGETPPTPTPGPSQPTPQPTPPPAPTGAPLENQLAEERRRREAAERQRDEAQNKLNEAAEAERTELERAQKKATDAEAKAATAEAKATRLERSAVIRTAAQAAGFHDPEDAVAHLSDRIGELDDEAKAKDAVEQLAKDKSHLVGKRPDPTAMGALPAGGTSPTGEPPSAGPQTVQPGGAPNEMSAEQAKTEAGKGILGAIANRRRAAGGLPATTGQD